jgi:peptidyl-tRNA hydrolase, PTH1 family
LIVGLGNPGREYVRTRHNVGFMVAEALAERWDLSRAKDRFRGRLAEGRVRVAPLAPGVGAVAPAPRVAVLCPQTYMNEAGRSVGPARGALKLALERVLVVHDEIDLPFGDVRTRLGGGLAGHNGLKSLKRELGGADFMRVRVGVGRPDSTDPEIVSAFVLGRFSESEAQVGELIASACEHVERAVLGEGE